MAALFSPHIAIRSVWFAWFISWVAAARWSNRTVERPGAGREALYRVLAAAGGVLLLGLYSSRVPTRFVLWQMDGEAGWAMVALAAAGFVFTWWARIFLGRLWSSSVTRKADHHLIDTGPYAIVRH